jgi:hypothetical protein
MDKTTFAGLTRLAPGDPLSTDGFSFQAENPQIIDRLLGIGAVSHRHDAHVALVDPTLDAVLSAVAGGGNILANTSVWTCYTLLDADGGETLPSDPQTVTTPAPLDPPDTGPSAALDTTAGSLLVGTYSYALTFTDANGGETTMGPGTLITRTPGPANARVQITGLTALLTAAGASGWRLWRSTGGGRYGLVAAGDTDTYTDDGSLPIDCTAFAPSRNTTNGVYRLEVTVPSGQPAEATQFRIYLSTEGDFSSPAVAGTYPIADAGTVKTFTTIDPAEGSPPDVSRALPGASKIDVVTEVVNLFWKSPVADIASLPATGNTVGDVRGTLDDFGLHMWGADDAWHDITAAGGGGGVTPLSWTALALSTGWSNGGVSVNSSQPAYFDAEWAMDDYGKIHLRGLIQGSRSNANLFILPAGARPAHFARFPVMFQDLFGAVWSLMAEVWPAVASPSGSQGQVYLTGDVVGGGSPASGSGSLWLDGISFDT